MIALRIARMIAHLLRGMAICAFAFPRTDEQGREDLTRRWSAQLLGICGVRVSVPPEHVAALGGLVVCNHVSWLDIFVLNSLQPCRFVAKSDIRSWPAIGWLCAKTGTIFIAREQRRDVRRIFQGIVASVSGGERVAFFPEGTTSAQGTLGSFHANLFEAAIEAGVAVQPYALRYTDCNGNLHPAADFIGDMTIAASILAVLRAQRRGDPLMAHLQPLPAIASTGVSRRELAAQTRSAIATALGVAQAPQQAVATQASVAA